MTSTRLEQYFDNFAVVRASIDITETRLTVVDRADRAKTILELEKRKRLLPILIWIISSSACFAIWPCSGWIFKSDRTHSSPFSAVYSSAYFLFIQPGPSVLWRQAAQIVWVPTPSHRSECLKENSSMEGLTVVKTVPITVAARGAIRGEKPACFIAGIRVLGRVRNSSSQTRAFSGTGKRIWKGWICPHKQAPTYVLALCDTNSELAHYHTVPSRYPFSFLNFCQIDSSK